MENNKQDSIRKTKESIMRWYIHCNMSDFEINEMTSKMKGVYIDYLSNFFVPINLIFYKKIPNWFIYIQTAPMAAFDNSYIFNSCGITYVSHVIIDKFIEIDKEYLNHRAKNKKPKYKTYVMYERNAKLYKIGKSENPDFREKTLCSLMPHIELLLIHERDIENDLHKKYDNKRTRGEWFDLSKDDIKYLNSIGFVNVNKYVNN